jgi:phage shock protein C
MGKRLFRSTENRIFGGVCAGFGDYFNIDPTIIRLLLLILFFAGGCGLLCYLIGWLIIPEK